MIRAPIPETLDALKVPVDNLIPYAANPRRGNVEVIVESLERHGQYRPIVVRSRTFEVLAGNHTLAAAKQLGWETIAATFVDVTDDEAARIVLVDNRSNDLATYDDDALVALLDSLPDLGGTGWAAEDIPRPNDPLDGELLALADITWGEPVHEVAHGDVWQLGRHTLVVAKLHREHRLWRGFLTDEVAFCPYPEPYLTASTLALEVPLLLVQPNKYLAGHLLDKHAAFFPDEKVLRLEGGG